MQISNSLIFQQIARLNICYHKDSRYFDNNIILRLTDKTKFEYYLTGFDSDIQDRIIDSTNNYFFVKDVSVKSYFYLPVVKLLLYFALVATNSNSAQITISDQHILKSFNIEERTLREYYKRLTLILPSLYYRYFDNLTVKENLFCQFEKKSDCIDISFCNSIYKKLNQAAQKQSYLNPIIFDNSKFNSKYDSKAFYIYLAYIFNSKIDFTKISNSCFENLEQINRAQQTGKHIKQQIYSPICKAINKLLFYNLLTIKQNSNSIFDFIFQNGYINEDNLYFTARQIEQYFRATKMRVATNKNLSEWKELNNLKNLDFIREYFDIFNLLNV